jgi:hypothetical protein
MPISPGYLADNVVAADGAGPDLGGDEACAVATDEAASGWQAKSVQMIANAPIRQAFRNGLPTSSRVVVLL